MKNPGGLLMIVVMIALVYGLMILPQRRQQKAKQNMVKSLAPGARILTAGGMYATVLEVRNDSIIGRLGLGEGLDVEFDQRAVLRVVQPAPQPEVQESQIDSE